MNKKFSKKKLLKIADSGLSDLSCGQIKELIKKESDKDYENINTDFIDLCFDVLEMKQKNSSRAARDLGIKIKKLTVRKTLLFAAVFMVLIITTLTVSAQVFNFNIPNEIAMLIKGTAEIDYKLEFADTDAEEYALVNSDLSDKIKELGIAPVTLPEDMIKENCQISKIENSTIDKNFSTNIKIDFKYFNYNGSAVITRYVEELESVGTNSVIGVISGQMIKVNGMDVLIFERKKDCIIKYKDNLTEYYIYLECDLETVLQFAGTIK